MKDKLKKNFIEKSINKYGNKFNYSKVGYKNTYTKVVLSCNKHGEFQQTPSSHIESKHGCPKCGYENSFKDRIVTKKYFIAESSRVHNNFYKYDKINYVNTTTPVEITCPTHGSFFQKPINHYWVKSVCPLCAIEKNKLSYDDIITRFKNIHNNKYGYDNVPKDIDRLSIINITCYKHGLFKQVVRSHLAGNGCGKCYIESTKLGKEKFIEQAIKVHGDRYDYSKVVYVNNKTKVTLTCKTHGDFNTRPDSHMFSGTGCLKCSYSKGEEKISNILKEFNINYIPEYSFDNSKYRFDFYLPDFNILIEYDGEQHFRSVEYFGGDEAYELRKVNDLNKDLLAISKNIPLIRIPYYKYDSLKTFLTLKLKSIYNYWLIVDNKTVAFKTFLDVCKEYDLPKETKRQTMIKNMNKKFITRPLFNTGPRLVAILD